MDNKHTHPILVRKITHLTDARYYAAMEVEWMSMQLTQDPASFHKWHAIRDWVEGVKLVAEYDPTDDDVFARIMIDAKPDAVFVHDTVPDALQTETVVFSSSALENKDTLEIYHVLPYATYKNTEIKYHDKMLFLEADWTPALLSALLATGYQGGICFHGEAELGVGLKDFEMMDEMMHLLGRDF